MIKRTLIALALFVLPALAFGQVADRDTLLTPDGTLYTVEALFSTGNDVMNGSNEYLLLTAQQGGHSTTLTVPESLTGGLHTSPVLAYDSDSGALFIFWEQEINNRQSTSLLFTSFQNGSFGPTTEFDAANYHLRHNLRIGVTHKTQDLDKAGQPVYTELNVHAIWWEETGYGEWARYAMLTIEKGNVTSIQIRNVSDLADPKQAGDPYQVSSDFNGDILRHPQVFESSAHDSVDLVYGDLGTNAFHRLTVKPVVNLRIRIPIGVRDNRFGAPAMRGDSVTSSVAALSSDHGLIFYSNGPGLVNYTMYKDGSWTAVRSITLNDKITADVAVNALRRLVTSD